MFGFLNIKKSNFIFYWSIKILCVHFIKYTGWTGNTASDFPMLLWYEQCIHWILTHMPFCIGFNLFLIILKSGLRSGSSFQQSLIVSVTYLLTLPSSDSLGLKGTWFVLIHLCMISAIEGLRKNLILVWLILLWVVLEWEDEQSLFLNGEKYIMHLCWKLWLFSVLMTFKRYLLGRGLCHRMVLTGRVSRRGWWRMSTRLPSVSHTAALTDRAVVQALPKVNLFEHARKFW